MLGKQMPFLWQHGGSLHYKPIRVCLLSTPLITLSTIIHHPHLKVTYLPLPLKGHQLHPESPSIFPWNKGGKRPFLPKPFSWDLLFLINCNSWGNCRDHGVQIPQGPWRHASQVQLIHQTLIGHKRSWVSPRSKLNGNYFSATCKGSL